MLGATAPAAPSPNIIDSSDGDEKVENSDLEPASSNTTNLQQSSQLPPKDSEACEDEEETRPPHHPSDGSMEGD